GWVDACEPEQEVALGEDADEPFGGDDEDAARAVLPHHADGISDGRLRAQPERYAGCQVTDGLADHPLIEYTRLDPLSACEKGHVLLEPVFHGASLGPFAATRLGQGPS